MERALTPRWQQGASSVVGSLLACLILVFNGRGNYRNDVQSLVLHFQESIPDPTVVTSFNAFGGLAGVDIELGDYR